MNLWRRGQKWLASLSRHRRREQASIYARAIVAERENIERLFADSPNYFAIWRGTDFVYEASNPANNEIVGCNPVGRKLQEVLPQADEVGITKILRQVYETGNSVFVAEIALDIGGVPRIFDGNYIARRNLDGDIDAIIASGADITQRVLNRRRLEQSQKSLAHAIRVARVGFYDWDVQRDQVEMSDGFCHIWQIEPGVTLHVATERIHPADRERVRQEIYHSLYVTKKLDTQYRVVLKDKSFIWLEAMGDVLGDQSGSPTHFFGTIRDITDLKNAKDALERQQHFNQSMIEQSPAGIALLRGPECVFVSVNSKWVGLIRNRTYLGQTLEETYADLPEIKPTIDGIKKVFHTAQPFHLLEAKVTVPMEAQATQERFFSVSAFPVRDGEGRPYGVFCQSSDISEIVWARETLKTSVAELHTERELRERFVATLTHDMRSPLTAARLCAERLLRGSAEPQAVDRAASRLIKALDRADHMVQNLLDANRIRAGEPLNIHPALCNLNELVDESVKDLNHLHNRTIVVKNPSEVVFAFCDSEAMRRVLDNLVGNAVKYGTPKRPITISLEIFSTQLCVSVHNHGPTIEADEQKTLFEPYHRAMSAIDSSKKGWGIGLSLVKAIAQAHNGHVAVRSTRAHGTRFSLYLPADGLSRK